MEKSIKDLVGKMVNHRDFGEYIVLELVSISKGRISIKVKKTNDVKMIVFTPKAFDGLSNYPDYLEENRKDSNLSKNLLCKSQVKTKKTPFKRCIFYEEEKYEDDDEYEGWLKEIKDDQRIDRGYLDDIEEEDY